MSEERFKEIFRRITAETPDAPAFSDLETHRAKPTAPIRLKPWMAAVGAAALVMVVVGAFGLLGGGGPDLAAPDENTIDYLKLEYSATVNPVCEGGEIIDNGGFDQATIEIWGPNSDDLTLMVATFPDGSTERTIVEGDPYNPQRAWGIDPENFDETTKTRVVRCEEMPTTDNNGFDLLGPVYQPGIIPVVFLGPPPESDTWEEALVDHNVVARGWKGHEVMDLHHTSSIPPDGTMSSNFYVDADDPTRLVGFHYEWDVPSQGSLFIEATVVVFRQIPALAVDVSFDTAGLELIEDAGTEVIEVGEIPESCNVTIPSQAFTPPEGYPATPSAPDSVWFGKDELWTVLSTDGISEERKSVWWSAEFTDPGTESSPDITVTYTLLGSPSLTIVNDQGTNASTPEDGLFIIAGSEPDIEGCWQVTAVYKNASLSYIYYNPVGQDPATATPTVVVPDVIGMTVELARGILQDVGIEGSVSLGVEQTDVVCSQDPAAGTNMTTRPLLVKLDAAPEGECPEPMTPTLGSNADFEIYSDEIGRVWYSTACMNADVLIEVGEDGDTRFLPMAGQTTSDKVEAAVVLARSVSELDDDGYLLGMPGVLDIRPVPRNGEVWDFDSDGDVVVDLQQDFMIEAVIDSRTFACPGIPAFYDGIPIAFVRKEISCHDEVSVPEEAITVFFNCGDGPDPNPTAVHNQEFGEIRDLLTATFGRLVVGPSFVESEQGFNSLFGFDTATSVEKVELVGSQLVVHFNESIATNNASTATGSAFFLAELYATAFQFEDVESVEFQINGSCEAFWEFLQAGPECTVIDRAEWEQMQSQWESG